MGQIGTSELIIILVIVVVLFGAKRLPDTAKSLGTSLKLFKKSIRDDDDRAEQGDDRDEPAGGGTAAAPRELTGRVDPARPTREANPEPNRTDR